MTTISSSTSSSAKKPVSVLCRKTWPKISEITKNGHIVFQVDARKSGYCGQKRFDCPSLAKAREKASEIEALYKNQGAEGAKLSLTGKHEINESLALLQQLNEKYDTSYSIKDAVGNFAGYLYSEAKRKEAPYVHKCVEKYLAEKQKPTGGKGGIKLRPRSLAEIKQICNRIKDAWGIRKITEISMQDIQDHLDKLTGKGGKPLTNRYKINVHRKISQFFNFCKKQPNAWIESNPCDGIILYPEKTEPSTLTNKKVELLLQTASEKTAYRMLMPYLVLGFFAGLRPSEIERLNWKDILWNSPVENDAIQIKIGAEISKVKDTRYAELSQNGVEWLKSFKKPWGSIGFSKKAFKSIRQELGLFENWKGDCIRHTYGSNWQAKHKNMPALSEIMGNSVSVLKRYYRRVIPADETNAYWELKPEA